MSPGAEQETPSPPPSPVLALDVSQYSGEISAEDWARAREAGVGLVVVKLSTFASWAADLAVRQLAAAAAAGLPVAGYLWCEFGDQPEAQVRRGQRIAERAGVTLRWLALDVEHDAWRGAAAITAWVRRAAAAVSRWTRPVVYTAAWFWRGHLGDPTDCADLPLWTAQYDGVADLGVWTPYGGWTEIVAKQYQGTTRYAGVHCDLNVVRGDYA